MPIVYQRADGGISVCVPCISQDDPNGYTMDQAYNRAMNKDIPKDAQNIIKLAEGVLPSGDVFRNAWSAVDAQGAVSYNMDEAKKIIDANLQSEMKGYADELDLLSKLGRDTAAVQANIADCQGRVAQLDAMAVPAKSDPAVLATLKSLIKGKANGEVIRSS